MDLVTYLSHGVVYEFGRLTLTVKPHKAEYAAVWVYSPQLFCKVI